MFYIIFAIIIGWDKCPYSSAFANVFIHWIKGVI